MLGKTISHYKILEKIGEGGMGEVYFAEDLRLGRKVAIKFLPQHLTRDRDSLQRFEREARVTASLNHPNIVTIFEIAEEDDQTYIVMEYVDGKSLRDVIDDYKMGLDKIIDIITQISEGLSKAHKAGIVHRDIKPENIIIDHDARVKILDFGLAKLKGVSKLTKGDSTLGTIHYMSPEQTRGSDVDHRSDIWSLGVVLYEMLTGDVPFRGDYDQAVVYSIQSEAIEPINDIPPELNKALNKLLAKDPEKRYQNLDAFKGDLSGQQGWKIRFSKRKRYIMYSIILIALVVIGFLLKPYVNFDASKGSSTGWENSIAVLPFENISNDPDQVYFCDGMTEQIITNLSKLKRLKVIARTSVMKFKGSDKTISEIGEDLNVAYLLESSIRKFGNRIRVTTKLINSVDENHVWSLEYDRDYQDLFNIQDEVAQVIVSNLLEQISPQELTEVKTNRPTNKEAYDYYFKGRYFQDRFFDQMVGTTVDTRSDKDFYKSEEMYLKAIELDSTYALSHAGLADLYFTYASWVERDSIKQKQFDSWGKRSIYKAYAIDQKSAYINRVMGKMQDDPEKEYQFLKNAYYADPNDDTNNFELGLFVFYRGLIYPAIKLFSRSIELNPVNTSNFCFRGWAYWGIGQYKEANIDFVKGLEIDQNNECLLRWYVMSLLEEDKIGKADEIASRYKAVFSDTTWFGRFYDAFNHAIRGDKERALSIEIDRDFLKRIIYSKLGMKDELLEQLKNSTMQVKEEKKMSGYLHLKYHHFYDFVRSDPRFQMILEDHKKVYQELLEKYGDIEI